MKPLYYMFCRFANVYKKSDLEKDTYIGSAAILMSVFMSFNVLSILPLFGDFILSAKFMIMWVIAPVMVVNCFFIFTKPKYKEYNKRWRNEARKKKVIRGWLIIIYMIVSAVCAILVATNGGYKDFDETPFLFW